MQSSGAAAMNVWLLDVDGVLNALANKPAEGCLRFAANGFLITYDPSIVQRIHGMHESGLVEVRWLTTWESAANAHLCGPFGWPQLALAGDRPVADEALWWKVALAKAVYDEGKRVVWTDDDLAYEVQYGHAAWVETADPGRLLAIAPEPLTGLTHAELDRVEAFLKQAAPNGRR